MESINTVLPGLGFHHIAVQTRDYEGTVRFYQEVLGCRLVHAWEADIRKLCLLDLGDGGHIEVIGTPAAPEPAPQGPPMIHATFCVDDVDAAIQRVRQAGCPITVEPKTVDLGGMRVRLGFFQGPNGEILEFFRALDP
jgi:glyoxylase I family protein